MVSTSLTPAGEQLLARTNRLVVGATITVTAGRRRAVAYTNTVVVTRITPSPRHKVAALLSRPVLRVAG